MTELILPKEIDSFKDAFALIGNERLIKYYESNFPIQKVLDFFMQRPGWERYLSNMIGIEFEKDLRLYLIKNGARNIRCEVPIITPFGNTSVDAVAEFDGELHTYEAKCVKKINNKPLQQIRKHRGYYKYAKTHLYIAKDTKVPRGFEKQLRKLDTDIIRSEKSKKDIIDDILAVQRSIRFVN